MSHRLCAIVDATVALGGGRPGDFLEKEDCVNVLNLKWEQGEELMGDQANLGQENEIFLEWGS